MNKFVRNSLLTSLVVIIISGCASAEKTTQHVSDDQRTADAIEQINQSTAIAVEAQKELAMTADAKVQGEFAQRKRLLTDVVSYDFYGDVEDILKRIAVQYGYEFAIYGKTPPERVNANIYILKKPVLEVIKQIGYTSTDFLDIVVKRDVIELHYKSK